MTIKTSDCCYRKLFETAQDGIVLIDSHTGIVLDVNKSMINLSGYSKKDFLKKHIWKLDTFKKVVPSKKHFVAWQVKGSKRLENIELKTKTGKKVTVDLTPKGYKVESRTLVQCSVHDITKYKQAEEALRKSEKRYHDIFEASKDALMLLGDKRFFDCNRATLKMFGYKTVKEFCKKHPGQVSPPFQPNGIPSIKLANKRIADTFKKGSNLFEWVHRRKNGEEFPASVLLVPFELEGKQVLQATVRDIGEQKNAEKEILDWAAVSQANPRPILRINKKGVVLFANLACNELLEGWTPTIGGKLRSSIRKIVNSHIHSKGYIEFEVPIKNKIFSCLPVPMPGHGYINLYFLDRTKRLEIERAKNSSELRYRRLFEAAKDGILILDYKTGEVVDANTFIIRLLGTSKEMILGKQLWQLGFFKDIAENKANFLHLKRKACIRYEDVPIKASNGEMVDVEFVSNVYDVDGEKVIQCNIRNITERKKAADALRKSRELLKESKDRAEAILASIGDAVVACDKTGKIILFNHVAAALSGFSAEEAMGRHHKKILNFSKENADEPGEDFIQKASTEGHRTFMVNHTVIINKHGIKTPVVNSAAPIFDKSGAISGCVVAFHDVTEAQRVDRAKTEFVSLASHQLRTPLTSIRWIVEMFLNGDFGDITDKQKENIETINQSSLRMVELVNALLNVSRLELGSLTIKTQPVKIRKILDETVMDFELQAKVAQITIARSYSTKLPVVMSDPALLKIILQNLISNAIDYSLPKTTITVKLEKDKENFLLTVRDQGIGILKDDLPKIFTKLFRADNARLVQTDGTGLGLYMTKSIVDMMNGKIWVDSKINKGTSFHVLLPLKGMTNHVGNGPMATSHVLPTEP